MRIRKCFITSTHLSILVLLLALVSVENNLFAADSPDYAVQVSATVQKSPAQITLSWPADPNATDYTVSRKSADSTSWGSGSTVSTSVNSYTDTNVAAGSAYDYRIVKNASGYTGYGYIYAGIELPLVESRGKVVLVVENSYATDLSAELARLQQDLAGDGWIVLRHDVGRTDSVQSVKNLIQADYNADSGNVKSVFLFGHVPVPYSGGTAWDGHVPQHQGAWASDVFYAVMDGSWTDSTVNLSSGQSFPETVNVPGDGKFDQSTPTSDVRLSIGRVDLANMPSFSKSEKELLRQYLNKDHNFRHTLITAQRRGIIHDDFGGFNGEAFASSGWRNFAPFFGAQNITSVGSGSFFPTLSSQSYLWAYGCGPGWVTSCQGVGQTSDFASYDMQAVFTMFFGSYFGDWDKQDNFLRAPLAGATYGLTSSWAGRPHWHYYHMAMGEPIGDSARLTQNNSGLYVTNSGARGTHIALMGDPTLRMHPVVPPSNFTASISGTGVSLAWNSSSDASAGYHVYRAASAAGPFSRVTPSPLSATNFTDSSITSGDYTYMVRALKLESSASGTYFNASQGIFASTSPAQQPPPPPPPPPAAHVGNGDGLFGSYDSNIDLTGTAFTRVDSTVNFDFGTASPIPGIGTQNYSVRWTGQVQPQYSETYSFYFVADDGVRLWVNGQQLIDKWIDQPATEYSGTITLAADQKYDIKIEYYQRAGGAVAKLLWGSASTSKAVIPQSQLYSVQPSLPSSVVVLTSSQNPSVVGQTISLIATVNGNSASLAPTGTVTLTEGSTAVGAVTLNNASASLSLATLPAGNHTITAAYSGDANFSASSSTLTQVVNVAAPPVTTPPVTTPPVTTPPVTTPPTTTPPVTTPPVTTPPTDTPTTTTPPATTPSVTPPPPGSVALTPGSGPQTTSHLTASVTTAIAGTPVQFTYAASSASSLSYSWSWGDGSYSTTQAGSATHTFAAAGTYTVAVAASDAQQLSTSDSLALTVTQSAASVPPAATLPSGVIQVQQLGAKLRFPSSMKKDSLSVKVLLQIADGFKPEGQTLQYNIAGVSGSAVLDKSGKYSDSTVAVSLAARPPSKLSRLSLTVRNKGVDALTLGGVASLNADTPAKGVAASGSITVILNGESYQAANLSGVYEAKADKAGKFLSRPAK